MKNSRYEKLDDSYKAPTCDDVTDYATSEDDVNAAFEPSERLTQKTTAAPQVSWYLEKALAELNEQLYSNSKSVEGAIAGWLNKQSRPVFKKATLVPAQKTVHQHALDTLERNKQWLGQEVAKAHGDGSRFEFLGQEQETLHTIETSLFQSQARRYYFKFALLLTASLCALTASAFALAVVTGHVAMPLALAETMKAYQVTQNMLMLCAFAVFVLGSLSGYASQRTFQAARSNSFLASTRSLAMSPETNHDESTSDSESTYQVL